MKLRELSRGETSIQSVLLIPVVFTVYFLGAQAAAFFHAAHIAQLAAEQGAQVAATAGTFTENVVPALNRMESVVAELGASMSNEPIVRESVQYVETTVSVRIPSIVPFLPTSVSRTTQARWERFLREQDR